MQAHDQYFNLWRNKAQLCFIPLAMILTDSESSTYSPQIGPGALSNILQHNCALFCDGCSLWKDLSVVSKFNLFLRYFFGLVKLIKYPDSLMKQIERMDENLNHNNTWVWRESCNNVFASSINVALQVGWESCMAVHAACKYTCEQSLGAWGQLSEIRK